MKKEPKFKWKSQTIASDFEQIQCPEYDEYKDFKMEPSGCYVLIRVTEEEPAQIECAIRNKISEKLIKPIEEVGGRFRKYTILPKK